MKATPVRLTEEQRALRAARAMAHAIEQPVTDSTDHLVMLCEACGREFRMPLTPERPEAMAAPLAAHYLAAHPWAPFLLDGDAHAAR